MAEGGFDPNDPRLGGSSGGGYTHVANQSQENNEAFEQAEEDEDRIETRRPSSRPASPRFPQRYGGPEWGSPSSTEANPYADTSMREADFDEYEQQEEEDRRKASWSRRTKYPRESSFNPDYMYQPSPGTVGRHSPMDRNLVQQVPRGPSFEEFLMPPSNPRMSVDPAHVRQPIPVGRPRAPRPDPRLNPLPRPGQLAPVDHVYKFGKIHAPRQEKKRKTTWEETRDRWELRRMNRDPSRNPLVFNSEIYYYNNTIRAVLKYILDVCTRVRKDWRHVHQGLEVLPKILEHLQLILRIFRECNEEPKYTEFGQNLLTTIKKLEEALANPQGEFPAMYAFNAWMTELEFNSLGVLFGALDREFKYQDIPESDWMELPR